MTTNEDRDFTVKVVVKGLKSNTRYFYGFSTDDAHSIVGMTRTTPSTSDGDVPLNIGLFSCSNWRSGYFHAYTLAASSDDLDLWLHVGDMIYEFGNYAYPATGEGNREGLQPAHETVSLSDYRIRHALHRTDPGAIAMFSRAPLVAVWDDHEFSDNADEDTSVNHQPTCVDLQSKKPGEAGFTPFDCDQDEGDWNTRVNAATRAFHEWVPITDHGSIDDASDRTDITQTLQWARLATFVAQDDRTDRTCVSNCGGEWTSTPITGLAFQNTDRVAYDTPNNELNQQIDAIAAGIQDQVEDEDNVVLSDDEVSFVQKTFSSSKSSGKPWQIYVSQSVMHNHQLPDLYGAAAAANPQIGQPATAILDFVFSSNEVSPPSYPFAVNIPGALFRSAYAMQQRGIALTQDSWDGYFVQREKMLQMFAQNTNNLVVLSGDSHNAWAFDLTLESGQRVGVEFSGPSISSYGYEDNTVPLWDFGLDALGFSLWQAAWLVSNPNMTYANPIDRGFVLLRINQARIAAEYYFIAPNGLPYTRSAANIHPVGSATLANPTWDGQYYCESMVTLAGSHSSQPGTGCISQFGSGLDPLAGSFNPVGSSASLLAVPSFFFILIVLLF